MLSGVCRLPLDANETYLGRRDVIKDPAPASRSCRSVRARARAFPTDPSATLAGRRLRASFTRRAHVLRLGELRIAREECESHIPALHPNFLEVRVMRSLVVGVISASAVILAGPLAACWAQSLNGSGSSFVAPMMDKWTRDYSKGKDIKINYTSLGSGSGIRQFLEKETDFGCTDAPLTDEHLNKAKAGGSDVVHVPLVLGGVVPAYNLSDVKDPLRFNGQVLAAIFLGDIKKWNDAAIKELNPGVDLPDADIVVCHRSDGSGSTAIFTDYLSKVSNDWK